MTDTGARVPATGAGGHDVDIHRPGKELYPGTGFTKADVAGYLERIAPVLLPHVQGRPASFTRFPDGVGRPGFFQKNAPKGTPGWIRTVAVASPGSTKGRDHVDHVVIEDTATLVWAANLAMLEIHVPQWRVGPRGGVRRPDLLVFDLDPGAPATVVECCRVAALLREALRADGLESLPKTSGSKGLQLYTPLPETSDRRTTAYARRLAGRLAADSPDLVVDRMDKDLRSGRVFIDWSQNRAAKTTIAPYSLRAREQPTVSAPVTWEEVDGCTDPAGLRFLAGDVVRRAERFGDLLRPLLTPGRGLPG